MKVLYIDIDTLRPDHMGCYGYYRNTTPNLDQVAREGVRFDRCYVSDAPCLPSRAALISGVCGIRNGAVGHGDTSADRRLTGPGRGFSDYQDNGNFNNIFRKAGMHTCSVSTFGERHSSYWYHAGFNEIYDVGGRGNEPGDKVVPIALDWLRRNRDMQDWYLHVHLWDPHTPYRTPADFDDPFTDTPVSDWITPEVFAAHRRVTGPKSINELMMFDDIVWDGYPKMPGKAETYDELRRVMDGYDMGIRYADALLGQLIDCLKAQGIYDETAIIITADHGENMGELGIYSEHGTADSATCRVPLVIKWPGKAAGTVDSALRYQLDLAPTMAELLGVQPSAHWDGVSFAGALDGAPCAGRDSLVVSQMAHVCQRSAVFGDWLYMRTVHDGFHLFDSEMLFNLKDDPHEQRDVKAEHPELCAQGAKIILDWIDAEMARSRSDADPMWTVMREGGPYHAHYDLAKYIARLRATGREDGAEALEKKYPDLLKRG